MSGSGPNDSTALTGGHVVTPDAVYRDGWVRLDGDRLAAVRRSRPADASVDRVIDVDGSYVLPGLVDLHGDDVERYRQPRSGDSVPVTEALTASDRLSASAGITTKFDAIAFEDAPEKNRTVERSADLVDGVADASGLLAAHRVHARCEVTNPEAVRRVESVAERSIVEEVSVMSHAPGGAQFEDDEEFARRYADGRGESAGETVRLADERADASESVKRQRSAELAAALEDRDVILASHDDADPAAVERAAELGASLCEFPVGREAARRAAELGIATAMGAPNLVRGGSLWGNLAVSDAIDEGLVDVLCSDYRPRALLASVFVDTGEPLHRRVARVTRNPAQVAGLRDRGRLVPGARADVAVVDSEPVPTARRVFVAGDEVYRAGSSASSTA